MCEIEISFYIKTFYRKRRHHNNFTHEKYYEFYVRVFSTWNSINTMLIILLESLVVLVLYLHISRRDTNGGSVTESTKIESINVTRVH